MSNGIRHIEGLEVVALDGLWEAVAEAESEQKIHAALAYAGCKFIDEGRDFISGYSVSLAALGGTPVASRHETDESIKQRIEHFVSGSKMVMGSSAAFSYLNNGEKDIPALYKSVTELGHFSIAHTVQVNMLVAGISQGTELELSLQRDIVHLSKLTNARTKVQNSPPIVVRDPAHIPVMREVYDLIRDSSKQLRSGQSSPDALEAINALYPVNKATILMISGDLSNFRKLTSLRDDRGKERELRDVLNSIYEQLAILWPEIMITTEKPMETQEMEIPGMPNDYFAERLLETLDTADPIAAAFEAQAVSNVVGFDFANFQDVVPRALDEIRETKEAYAEEGPDARAHFGDETADIMFSLVNLARHAGLTDLESLENLAASAASQPALLLEETLPTIDDIGQRIIGVAELEGVVTQNTFLEKVHELFAGGVQDAMRIATAHGFEPSSLLTENVRKYLDRCKAIEQLAQSDGKQWSDLSANGEIVTYWKRAKSLLG